MTKLLYIIIVSYSKIFHSSLKPVEDRIKDYYARNNEQNDDEMLGHKTLADHDMDDT